VQGRSGIQRFAIEPKYAVAAMETLFGAIDKKMPTAELPEFIQDSYEGDFSLFADAANKVMARAGMFPSDGKQIPTKTFMNRLLGIPLTIQGQVKKAGNMENKFEFLLGTSVPSLICIDVQIFTFWHQLMESLIRDDKLTGKYQEGILDIATELNTVVEETVVYTDPDNQAETKYIK